ncbi:MAG: PQQ-binding-like beta-propeller repeat protein [Planctomycetota bacterium]|nr:PQQ-binding-like beta-propeller repeat protein [Planctomycetota bacterium]
MRIARNGLFMVMVLAGCMGWRAPAEEPAPKEDPPKTDPKPEAAKAAWFRSDGGLAPDAEPVLQWDHKKNIVWKAPVGAGYASPILAGDKILVLSEPDVLTCVGTDGKVVWTKATKPENLPEDQKKKVVDAHFESGFAAATPATDGTSVFIVLANGIVASYEIATGKLQWTTVIDLPPISTEGRSASPVMADGKLIVHLTALIALDPKTGKELWRNEDAVNTYASPCAGKVGDVAVIGTPSGFIVRASDGKILAKDIGSAYYSSPAIKSGVFYLMAGSFVISSLGEKIEGDKLTPKETWSDTQEGDPYSSPLIHEGLIYTATTNGKYSVLDPKEKKRNDTQLEIASMEMGGGGGGMIYGSPVLAGKHVFLSSTDGKTVVIEPGLNGKVIHTNDIVDGTGSTPLFVGKRIYMRGGEQLFCIGEK